MIASIIFSIVPTAALAVEVEEQSLQEMTASQQEIDSIFTELNELAAEEKMQEFLANEGKEVEVNTAAVESQNDIRKQYLEDRLESLGVNAINPDNPEDMAALEEVMRGNSSANTRSISDPPSLETFADCYSLHQYTSNVLVDGVDYTYSYIYVTDNKGYSGSPLTHSQTTNILIGKESTVLRDILDHQFSFGFSAYLGLIPGGWVADWAIGTVFTALNSFKENSIISYAGNNNIYNMSMLSVTQMMYVYVYLPSIDDWELCGTRAPNISYTRAEYLIANVAGTAVSDAKSYPTVTSGTGVMALNYVQTYSRNSYHDIDYIGSFTVNAYNGATVRFAPGFAPYPTHLL